MTIRVALTDDHNILRSGLRLILEQEPDMEVVAEADNGLAAVKIAAETKPDVIVMDLTMPKMNGIDATRRIKEQADDIGVLILSVHIEKRYIIEALRVGANGFMPKGCTSDELISAIRAIAAHETYLSPKVAGIVVETFVRGGSTAQDEEATASLLTPREREVLQHIAEGKTTKETAFLLKLSGKTVDTYRMQIMRKLNLYSIAELTRFAIREGITPP